MRLSIGRKSVRRVGSADFAGDPASFVFERPDGEGGRGVAVEKVISNPLLETATSFALRDMDEIVQEQFAITPRLRTNDDRVTDSDATRIRGDDTSAPSRVGQLADFRQRDPIDHQHSNALNIPNTGPARVSHVL